MTTLLLIRHGESQANLSRRFAGHIDVPLTDLGEKQAACTAEFIIHNYLVDGVYASDLRRAFRTGEAVAQRLGLPVIPDEALREIFAGRWEGLPFTEIAEKYPKDYHCWMTDIGHCRTTGGESTAELLERVEGALHRIAQENPGKTIVVATHATVIRVLQCKLSGFGLEKMKDIPWTVNASVTELRYENGAFSLGKVGQYHHLAELKREMPANV